MYCEGMLNMNMHLLQHCNDIITDHAAMMNRLQCFDDVRVDRNLDAVLLVMQTAVKGSQGAGRVDESLDSSIAGNEPVAEPSKPKGPARPAGAKGKKKGKR